MAFWKWRPYERSWESKRKKERYGKRKVRAWIRNIKTKARYPEERT